MNPDAPPGATLHRIQIDERSAGLRLDKILADHFASLGISRNRIQSYFDEGRIRIAGQTPKPSCKPSVGEWIEVRVPTPPSPEPQPEKTELSVLYEDSELLVVEKPAGMVVHPTPNQDSGTLVNALLGHTGLSSIGAPKRPGIVHRLDKGTSGLLVVAKTDPIHLAMKEMFKARTVQKVYLALVYGRMGSDKGEVKLPVGRSPRDRTKMSTEGIKPRDAWTSFKVREELGRFFSYLEVEIHTGRTHQIRVHLNAISHPIVGDPKYGGERWRDLDTKRLRDIARKLERPFLHAHRLRFRHPGTGEIIDVVSELPADLRDALDRFQKAVAPPDAPSQS